MRLIIWLQTVLDFGFCDSDRCGINMGGQCNTKEDGERYECTCIEGFRKITSSSGMFERCAGTSFIDVHLIY